MKHWKGFAAALFVPLALAACLFAPGKFESALTIHADRSFTYSYKGEVVAVDFEGIMDKAMSGFGDALSNSADAPDSDAEAHADSKAKSSAEESAEKKAKKDAEYRAIAEKLRGEAGYRDVQYRGEGVFWVDYEISGVLTHNFVFPYNQDTGMFIPFVGIELRGKDTVRVKAPGFAKASDSDGGMGAGEEALQRLDGSFTLTTDAEIVSSNATAASAGGQRMSWRVDPATNDAPTAVLRVKALP